MERFWLWLRRNLDTEQIMLGMEREHRLHVEMRSELDQIRAAVGDMRRADGLPAMVHMEDIDERRPPAGDPTGL